MELGYSKCKKRNHNKGLAGHIDIADIDIGD